MKLMLSHPFTYQLQNVIVVFVTMLLILPPQAINGYQTSTLRRVPSRNVNRNTFYQMYGSESRYNAQRKYYTLDHDHPHPPQSVAIPVRGDRYDVNTKYNQDFLHGYGDSLLIPIEGLLRDLAGHVGYKQSYVPSIVRNIKHEFYIGANKLDPILHSILQRHGFIYTGNPHDITGDLDLGYVGSVEGILGSMGLSGRNRETLTNGYETGRGTDLTISTVQNPLPRNRFIDDNIFDEFSNGMMANTNTGSTHKQERQLSSNSGNNMGSNTNGRGTTVDDLLSLLRK